jgi:hypothetical protein
VIIIQFVLLHTRIDKFLVKKDALRLLLKLERVELNQKEHALSLI